MRSMRAAETDRIIPDPSRAIDASGGIALRVRSACTIAALAEHDHDRHRSRNHARSKPPRSAACSQHLMHERTDVQNIDLMILAGFCRNCLADWYREAAEARGITMTSDEAREAVYGMPFAQWKAQHQPRATPEQLAAFEAAQRDAD